MKILAVDDERPVLELFKSLLVRTDLHEVDLRTAHNGEAALASMRSDPPDLLVTDLKMPKMDGLSLIRVVKESWPGLPIIVLSAHSEFDLVKRAFSLGAFDYILKAEMTSDQIGEILRRAHDSLIRTRDEEEESRSLVLELVRNRSIVEANSLEIHSAVVRDMIANRELDTDLAQLASAVGIDVAGHALGVILVQLRDTRTLQTEAGLTDLQCDRFLQREVAELLGSFVRAYSFRDRPGCVGVLVVWLDQAMGERIQDVLSGFHDAIGRLLSSYGDIAYSVSYGHSGGSSPSVRVAYERSSEAMSDAYVKGSGIYVYRQSPRSDQRFIYDEIFEAWRRAIVDRDVDHVRETPRVLRDLIDRASGNDAEEIREFFGHIHSYLNWFNREELNPTSTRLSELVQEYDEGSRHNANVPERLSWFAQTTGVLADEIGGTSVAIRKVIARIRENIAHDISRAELARFAHVSESYLSRRFADEIGVSLKKFITHERMKKAAALIRSGEYLVYEVAEKVGFESTEHFSRTFKQHFGIAPSHFS